MFTRENCCRGRQEARAVRGIRLLTALDKRRHSSDRKLGWPGAGPVTPERARKGNREKERGRPPCTTRGIVTLDDRQKRRKMLTQLTWPTQRWCPTWFPPTPSPRAERHSTVITLSKQEPNHCCRGCGDGTQRGAGPVEDSKGSTKSKRTRRRSSCQTAAQHPTPLGLDAAAVPAKLAAAAMWELSPGKLPSFPMALRPRCFCILSALYCL